MSIIIAYRASILLLILKNNYIIEATNEPSALSWLHFQKSKDEITKFSTSQGKTAKKYAATSEYILHLQASLVNFIMLISLHIQQLGSRIGLDLPAYCKKYFAGEVKEQAGNK